MQLACFATIFGFYVTGLHFCIYSTSPSRIF